MAAPNPSALAMVPFVSVQDMMRIVNAIGPRQMLREICAYIEADFLRWETFDKTPRIPAHSEEGGVSCQRFPSVGNLLRCRHKFPATFVAGLSRLRSASCLAPKQMAP